MTGSVYPSKEFVALGDKFVGVAQHSGHEHGDEAVTVNGEKKRLCNDFGSIPCDVHENMGQQLARRKIAQDVKAVPTHVFILPDGTEVSRYVGAMAVKQLEEKIAEAAKKLGKGTTHAEYLKRRESITKAEKEVNDGVFRAAIQDLKWLEATKKDTPLVDRAKKLLDEIDEKGKEALDTAKALSDAGNADEAAKAFAKVAKDFAGRPVEKEARKAAGTLKPTKVSRIE